MIYDEIKKDLIDAIKNKDKLKLSVLRVLISDIQRKSDKDYNDDHVISIINQTLKFLAEANTTESETESIILKKYLPTQISEDVIIKYIDTLDIAKINPMAAIGKVMKHFPKGSVNGKVVKNIITNYIN